MLGMDMGRILTIFNSMKNVNMSGTPASKVEEIEEEEVAAKPCTECVNCSGIGQIDLGWGETVPCRECKATGMIEEAFGRGMDLPTFKPGDTVEFCGEYATVLKDYGDELMVDLGGGQGKCKWYKMFQGEPVTLVKKSIKEYSDGRDAGPVGDSGSEDEGPMGKYGAGMMWQRDEMDIPPEHSFKDEIAGEKFSDQSVNDHSLTVGDQLEQEGLEESAPPDQESWVKKNKSRFKKEYGDKKGEEVLYATAWKKHNKGKKTNEGEDTVNKKIEECDGCTASAPGDPNRDAVSVNASYNSDNNEKSVTVTARNNSADELMRILKLSGIMPGEEVKAEIAPEPEPAPVTGLSAVVVSKPTNEAFSEFPPELDDQEAARNSMYCDACGGYHSGPCPQDEDPNLCKHCHENEKVEGTGFCQDCHELGFGEDWYQDQLMNSHEPDDFEEYNRNEAMDYMDESVKQVTEGKLKDMYTAFKNYLSDVFPTLLRPSDNFLEGLSQLNPEHFTAEEIGKLFHTGTRVAQICIDTAVRRGEFIKQQDASGVYYMLHPSKKTVSEGLSPKRENTGLNGAPKTWQNEPNEQMAGWKALIQDTDGLSQPHDMFNPVKGSDNIMTVADKKKEQEKPSGDFAVNAIREKLEKKFAALEESDDSVERMQCCKCGKNTSRFNCRCGHKLCSSCKDAPPNKKKVKESKEHGEDCPNCNGKLSAESCAGEMDNYKGDSKKKVTEGSKVECKICGDALVGKMNRTIGKCRKCQKSKKPVKEGFDFDRGFCIWCEKRLPKNWDSDLCKGCLKKEEAKKSKKVTEGVHFHTESGDEYIAPSREALAAYRAAVDANDWDKVREYEETWTSVDSLKAKAARKKMSESKLGDVVWNGEPKNLLSKIGRLIDKVMIPDYNGQPRYNTEITKKYLRQYGLNDSQIEDVRKCAITAMKSALKALNIPEDRVRKDMDSFSIYGFLRRAFGNDTEEAELQRKIQSVAKEKFELLLKKYGHEITESTMKPAEITEEVSKSQAKKLQAALDNLEQRVKKLSAPPSPKTKITQSLERFTTKIDAIKDALAKAKGEGESEESEEKPEPKKSEGKSEEKSEKKAEKPSEKEETKKEEGKEAEPKPKEQKETASDEPDTNGDDKAPKGKVKDIGKGIYESESARMESLRQIIIEGMGE